MPSVVTERFIKCHDYLKEQKLVKSSRQFALSLDYLPQSLSEILKRRRDVTIELLRQAIATYKLNPLFLFTGEGPMFTDAKATKSLKVLTVVSNNINQQTIVHVPIPAQTSYANASSHSAILKELPTFSLPEYKYKVGSHRSFEVSGDDMEPTLFEGDKVVCSFVDPDNWSSSIRNNHVYLIVTQGDVIVKRVKNTININDSLHLSPDNSYYKSYDLAVSQIREIWHVKVKISPFLQAPTQRDANAPLSEEVDHLKQLMFQQIEMIDHLNKTIKSKN